jgi:hypothetical protein
MRLPRPQQLAAFFTMRAPFANDSSTYTVTIAAQMLSSRI